MPAYRRAKQLLDEGRIGDLEQITVEFGRTLLMWNLPHATDLLVQFSQGRPARAVRAVAVAQSLPGDAPGSRLDADPVLRTGWVDLGGEVEGVISAARGMNLVLEGREARLIVAADGSRLRLERAAGGSGPYRQESEELPFEIGPSGTVRAFRSLRDAVLGQGGGGLPGLAELERAHEILFALAASALRGGEAVDPDEQEEGLVVTGLTSGLPA
jgi:predicted dehydrogenase